MTKAEEEPTTPVPFDMSKSTIDEKDLQPIEQVANEVMENHINHELLTRKLMSTGASQPCPPVDLKGLEQKFIQKVPRYQMSTTSRMLKEMEVSPEYLDEFKEKFWQKHR